MLSLSGWTGGEDLLDGALESARGDGDRFLQLSSL